jgi:hypothetical protein
MRPKRGRSQQTGEYDCSGVQARALRAQLVSRVSYHGDMISVPPPKCVECSKDVTVSADIETIIAALSRNVCVEVARARENFVGCGSRAQGVRHDLDSLTTTVRRMSGPSGFAAAESALSGAFRATTDLEERKAILSLVVELDAKRGGVA